MGSIHSLVDGKGRLSCCLPQVPNTRIGGTHSLYLRQVAASIQACRFENLNFNGSPAPLDLRYDESVSYTGNAITARPIKLITTELKRWEVTPSRREPMAISMLDDLERQTHQLLTPHHTLRIMHDWLSLGIYFGFRRLEWLRPNRARPIEIDALPRAFTVKDIRFYCRNMIRLTHNQALRVRAVIEDVDYLEIT